MVWNIISGQQVGEWVAKRIQGGYFAERSNALGLERDGEIVAGVIYQDWNHKSIVCHIAVDGRLTPAFLAAICDYPFNVCQVDKIIVPVASENANSKDFVEKFGFTEEARIKEAHPDGDIILYTLTRDNCRYLGERYVHRMTVH